MPFCCKIYAIKCKYICGLRLPGEVDGMVVRVRSNKSFAVCPANAPMKPEPASAGIMSLPLRSAWWHALHCC